MNESISTKISSVSAHKMVLNLKFDHGVFFKLRTKYIQVYSQLATISFSFILFMNVGVYIQTNNIVY